MRILIFALIALASTVSSARDFYYSEDNYIYTRNSMDGVSITPHISTLGYGSDLTFDVGKSFTIRGEYNYFKGSLNSVSVGMSVFRSDVILNTIGGMIDYSPFGGFRVSVGAFKNNNRATLGLTGATVIGGTNYTAGQVGSTTVDASYKNSVAPYVGVGYRFGDSSLGLDVSGGVMYQGNSKVNVRSTGSITAADLDRIKRDTVSRLDRLRMYPVVSIGFFYKF